MSNGKSARQRKIGECQGRSIGHSSQTIPETGQNQRTSQFTRLHLIRIMEDLIQECAVPFPRTIARISFPTTAEHFTRPNRDWIFVGGSTETISCWIPLGDVPEAVGGLRVLAGSHKAGFLEPRQAGGPGGKTVDVDPSLEWHQSGFRCGDILLFKMFTVHAAAANRTPDEIRLSIDVRYAGESHAIGERWLRPDPPMWVNHLPGTPWTRNGGTVRLRAIGNGGMT